MDSLLVQAAQYGFGGVMVAVLIFVLWRQNQAADTRAETLAAKLDKQSEWQIQFIESNTRATMGAAAAHEALTKTMQELVRVTGDLDRSIRERLGK